MKQPSLDKDYKSFLQSKGSTPPEHVNKAILDFVKCDLEPSHKIVFLKLISVQLFIGLITLVFCPQFELSLTNNHELYHYFHYTFGSNICFAICGSLFIGSGAVFSAYILKKSEIRKIKKSKLLYFLAVSIIALSLFMFFGAKVYLTAIIFWMFGAVLGGLVMFELNTLIRKNLFLLSKI